MGVITNIIVKINGKLFPHVKNIKITKMEDQKQIYPKYKSHKVVEAFKIIHISNYDNGLRTLFSENYQYNATIGELYTKIHKPQIGGYWVRYEDGYESFSPAEAFESGYTKIEDGNPLKYLDLSIPKIKKAYFARAISQYHNKQDERDIATIEAMGFEVINPSKEAEQKEYAKIGMAHFEQMVDKCDVLIFRAFLDNKIGAGVGKEILRAASNGKPVLELPNFIADKAQVGIDRFLNVDATRFYLTMLGQR